MSKNVFELLTALCVQNGVSGAESSATDLCVRMFSEYGETSSDDFGNVICLAGKHSPDKKTLLLDAHLDEIGMIVNYVCDDGFLKVSPCGGIDERVLPASQVAVYGKEKLCGVITSVPPHLSAQGDKTADMDDLFVDTGLTGVQARELIPPGSIVLIENKPVMMGGFITSKALDNRASIAALILTLENLRNAESAYNITVLLSSGEETGLRGAKIAAYTIEPDIALISDVSFGAVHGEDDSQAARIGGGAMIGISPALSRKLSDALIKTAQKENIPFQYEVMSSGTGTNADAVALTKCGCAACTVSIPIRYMHTPVESVLPEDIENAARLIAGFCERGLF